MHFIASPEILSAPTILQLGSFHLLFKVEPWYLTADMKSHLQTIYAQSIRITLASPVLQRPGVPMRYVNLLSYAIFRQYVQMYELNLLIFWLDVQMY
jgi:hypothetical protein